MFDPEISKIVFLISADVKHHQIENLKRAILNFLFQFHKSNPSSAKPYHKQFAENVRWSFQFLLKKPRNYSMLQEWKELKYAEVCLFEQKLEKHHSVNQTDESPMKNQASILSEALKAVVHDYSWDDHGLISPVKKPAKRPSQSTKNCSLIPQVVDRFSSNIVAIVSPLPKSQTELDEFFDWQNTDQEYVCRKLMPPHLRVYFRQKYDISLLWIDTPTTVCPNISNDIVGMNIIRSFLNSLGGDILPDAVFSGSNSSNGFNVLREVGSFPFLYSSKEGSITKNSEKNVTIHVAKTLKHEDESLKAEEIFSLTIEDTSISSLSLRQLFEYPCYLCSKQFQHDRKPSHPIHVSKDKDIIQLTISGGLQKINLTNETATESTTLQNVLVVMGKFMKEQVPLLLNNSEIKEMCSVWCKIEWSSSRCDPSTLMGSFVAEVYRYCSVCRNESSIEELGIKYAIIEMKTKSIATITYIRLKSSMLLNPSCWLPRDNSYSVSSPLKRQKELANVPQISEKEPVSHTFCSSMLEDWYLMKPLPSSVGIIYPKSKASHQKLAKQEWMAKLQQHYKEKSEAKEKDISGCRMLADSELPSSGTTLDNSQSPLELKEEFLKSINKVTYSDLTTAQIHNLICSMNSLYSSIKRDHLKSDPSVSEYIEKLKNLECFYAITDIKQLAEKNEQTNLLVMQVMLIIKFVECHLDEKKIVDVVNDITSHLRFISLTAGHSAMINFLDKILVDKYFDVCGKVLYEVYNELMLPVPELLQAYSREEEDTTHSDSVLFSVNSFNSQASNLGSSKSCGVADAASRRQRFGTSSVSQLRRIIEIPSQTVSDGTKPEENEARPRVRKASKSKNKGIIRDLFSAQDTPHTEKAIFESPDSKRQRNIYVSETPKVKQHMTAFTRQSLRMQKKHLSDGNMQGITIIEESPAKEGEALNDFKSSKLTRRHSFYCDGKDSRNVTRAKSIQQHQQGVLATPVVKVAGGKGGSSPKFGRRSLSSLFRSPIKESSNENQATGTTHAVIVHAQNSPSPAKILCKSHGDSIHSPRKMSLRRYHTSESQSPIPNLTLLAGNSPSPAKIWKKSLGESLHSPMKMALRGYQAGNISSENQPTSPDLTIYSGNPPTAKISQKDLSNLFHSPQKTTLRGYQAVNTVQNPNEDQARSPDSTFLAENSPSTGKSWPKPPTGSFQSPRKMTLRGYQAVNMVQSPSKNRPTNPNITIFPENSPSPAKISQKPPSESLCSPLKMALRGHQSVKIEPNVSSSENPKLGSSPKVWRRSLSKLFDSPLLSNPSESKRKKESFAGKTQKQVTNDSASSNIFGTTKLEDPIRLIREDSLDGESNALTPSELSSPNGHGRHSNLNSISNTCSSEAINHRHSKLRKRRTQKRRKSSSTSG